MYRPKFSIFTLAVVLLTISTAFSTFKGLSNLVMKKGVSEKGLTYAKENGIIGTPGWLTQLPDTIPFNYSCAFHIEGELPEKIRFSLGTKENISDLLSTVYVFNGNENNVSYSFNHGYHEFELGSYSKVDKAYLTVWVEDSIGNPISLIKAVK